ncbi:MAG: ferritin-like domain-containing protein [Sedimentisphaerales bacterium]
MEKFNIVNDILDFAIEGEIEAHKFYTDLAAKMTDKTMKQVFLDFAVEELGHKKLLEDAKAGKKVLLKKEQIADLKIAEFTVAVKPTPNMTFKDALILAMQKEKKAFQLYTRLAHLTIEKEAAELFAALAQQEAKHKLRFELEYDDVVLKED